MSARGQALKATMNRHNNKKQQRANQKRLVAEAEAREQARVRDLQGSLRQAFYDRHPELQDAAA